MKYVAVDIGCIECGEPSTVLGIFNDKNKANKAMKQCEKYQEEHWYGQHIFEIFEIKNEDELASQYYKKCLKEKE